MAEVEGPKERKVGRWHQTYIVSVFAKAEIGHETDGLVIRTTLDEWMEVHQQAKVHGKSNLLHPSRVVLLSTLFVSFSTIVGTDSYTSNWS